MNGLFDYYHPLWSWTHGDVYPETFLDEETLNWTKEMLAEDIEE